MKELYDELIGNIVIAIVLFAGVVGACFYLYRFKCSECWGKTNARHHEQPLSEQENGLGRNG